MSIEAPAPSGRVVRDVEPSALADLLAHVPRATVAFVDDGRIDILPARARFDRDSGVVALGIEAGALDGREIVLVVDSGPYWFELRAVMVRGTATPEPVSALGDGLCWYTVERPRLWAWDYGALRRA